MISILAQERLLGATLGTLFTGIMVFEQRRYIYKTISDTQALSPQQAQMEGSPSDSNATALGNFNVRNKGLIVKEPIFGKKSRSEVAHLWNKTVDQTFGPLIEALSSRGW